METVLSLIGKSNFDQLGQIADRVKLQRTFIQNQTRRSLVIGDNVEFAARGFTINGSVTKLNRKTAMVRQESLHGFGAVTNWKVPIDMLKKAA